MFNNKYFHSSLAAYINGGFLTRRDFVSALLFPKILFKRNAKRIIHLFNEVKKSKEKVNTLPQKIQIEFYRGNNTYVQKMIDYLKRNLGKDLLGAYVHGSLGTYEENTYSDFDALVILKNEVFSSPARLAKVAERLNRARTIMFDFDPLQHHGWFVLIESDLDYFPELYFPPELFRYAKSLLMDQGLELLIHLRDSEQNRFDPFLDISDRFIKRLVEMHYPINMYQLKGLLSQFMLLPTLYIQARYNRGIFKKFSFSEAKKDFSLEDWSIMDEVSSIRSNWNYEISKCKRWIMTQSNFFGRRFAKRFAPKIPDEISLRLTPEFFIDMKTFIQSMQSQIST